MCACASFLSTRFSFLSCTERSPLNHPETRSSLPPVSPFLVTDLSAEFYRCAKYSEFLLSPASFNYFHQRVLCALECMRRETSLYEVNSFSRSSHLVRSLAIVHKKRSDRLARSALVFNYETFYTTVHSFRIVDSIVSQKAHK